MNMETFDAIAIGAGAMGSAAAYHLSKAKQRVLLLEQFDLDHQKGSSYGSSRIIRYSYDHPVYIALAKAAYPDWMALQAEAGEQLYQKTGGIDFGPPDATTLIDTIDCLKRAQVDCELLTAAAAEHRFPQFKFDREMQILYQPDTGVLAASRCVWTHLRLAMEGGATVQARTPVTNITIHQNGVEVETARGRYAADRLIVTAGAWTKELLSKLGLDLPLIPVRCQLAFFEPASRVDYESPRLPVFIAHLPHRFGKIAYGIPGDRESGLKVAFHGGQSVGHPGEIDYSPDDSTIESIRQFSRQYIPGANGALKSTRICLYTMTPDEHFILDRHPEHAHVVFGAGFSGHGFKFSPLIGGILCDLVLEGKTKYDISLFRATRFKKD